MASGHVFVVLGAHVRVMTPINICHFKFGRIELFFDVHVRMVFVLTTTVEFNIGHSQILKNCFAYMLLEIWDSLHIPHARWLAYCGLHILA